MTPRTILAVLDGTSLDPRVLDTALAVGQPNGSCITALFADIDPHDVPAAYLRDGTGLYVPPEFWTHLKAQIAARRDAAKSSFEAWRLRNKLPEAPPQVPGPTARLHIEIGLAPRLLGRFGPATDLVVTGLPGSGEPGRTPTLEAALFDTGRPVLAVSTAGPTEIAPSAPVAVAWNGRPEAARALGAALPILARCQREVILLCVDEREGAEKIGPVVEYLAMHGIAAQGIRLADRPHETGALLLEEATRRGAGLLVMGAYTHTRMRESILGGVTDHILRHAALPVLFAH
ncbi:MAG TPA: universal stress protein [Aliidongia sp.]|nr:universal stress protein [Aliidongia sp.]